MKDFIRITAELVKMAGELDEIVSIGWDTFEEKVMVHFKDLESLKKNIDGEIMSERLDHKWVRHSFEQNNIVYYFLENEKAVAATTAHKKDLIK